MTPIIPTFGIQAHDVVAMDAVVMEVDAVVDAPVGEEAVVEGAVMVEGFGCMPHWQAMSQLTETRSLLILLVSLRVSTLKMGDWLTGVTRIVVIVYLILRCLLYEGERTTG